MPALSVGENTSNGLFLGPAPLPLPLASLAEGPYFVLSHTRPVPKFE